LYSLERLLSAGTVVAGYEPIVAELLVEIIACLSSASFIAWKISFLSSSLTPYSSAAYILQKGLGMSFYQVI